MICFGLMLRLRPPDYQGLVAGYQSLVAGCRGLVGAGQAISKQLRVYQNSFYGQINFYTWRGMNFDGIQKHDFRASTTAARPAGSGRGAL